VREGAVLAQRVPGLCRVLRQMLDAPGCNLHESAPPTPLDTPVNQLPSPLTLMDASRRDCCVQALC
jgi:hypothetical protein